MVGSNRLTALADMQFCNEIATLSYVYLYNYTH